MKTATARILAAGLLLGQTSGAYALAEPSQYSIPEIRAIFEQELFELAHTVFLANGNLKEALAVTQRAVKARPGDPVWRKKAAQTAEWAGRPDLALEQWFYLARQGNHEARQSVLRLSRGLQEFPLRKQLLEQTIREGNADPALQREYLAVAEGMGLPQDAYALLASGDLGSFDPVWRLTEEARLAEQLGQPADALQAWEKRAALKPLDVDESLKLASLWYGQSDVIHAWQVLKQAAATAPAGAVTFWRTYADLAWAVQETASSARASEQLIATGQAIAVDYQRLLELYSGSDPRRAYGYALAGWQRFHTPLYWYAMADTGLRSGKAKALALFLKNLGAEERGLLARDARSWMAMAQVYRQTGNPVASLTAARVAARLAAGDADLLAAYLWMLVDLKQVAELRPLVREWEARIGTLPALREPLAAAMVLLGDTPRALRHYQILAAQHQADPAWLASFADLLEQAGRQEVAWTVRRRAYRLLHQQIQNDLTLADARTLRLTQAQLLLHLAPGDPLSARIRRIAEGERDNFANELILGWAMTTGQTDLARLWYWKSFARAVTRPEWARLGLALEENDRDTMAELLDRKLEQLPYRDAIEAAQRSGSIPLAQEHAWQRLQLNREDNLVDAQVRQLFGLRPGYLATGLKLQDQSGVGWAESRLTLAQPVSGRYSLKAELTERQFSLLKSNALGALPDHDLSASLTLTRQHERGQLALTLGGRDGGLDSFVTASLAGNWQPWRDLQLAAGLELNGRADETAALSVGGTRDRLRLTALGTPTPAVSFALELAAARFHDQAGHYLGQGQSAELDVRHQFTRAWPDYGVRLFGGYTSYTADGSVSNRSAMLVPATASPTAAFFVPASFGHLGAGLFLGQAWKSSYSRDWKPFAEADFDWNSNSGAGFSYGAGLVGPVFGLDQLMFEVTQGSGKFGSTDLTTTIGVNYRYFY
ncbi:tetratricopeptide repeat protein [Trichlorobacter lovleyi]|uniref:tetratricopeptide repeat protein n=1 Tax=Trichlorobacter lovleyi TaxID=313985 RepID=UPI002240D749|nr:tetratricopeptide repeat protein [Trichlorobacter lovleyi]QOX80179.1 tetratricopeptide repeat protein [Trichlorobacter lovleyi]